MGNRKPINISQCLTITNQGVLDDYINVWSSITAVENLYSMVKETGKPLSPDEKTEIKEILNKRRSSYESYIHQRHSDFEGKIIENSNMEIVYALNHLADSYNLIRENIAKELNIPLAVKYVELAAFLIQGKE